MATISISNLNTSGAELFLDAETYLHELTDSELDMTKGGCFDIPPIFKPTTILKTTSIVGYILG
ncbi:hypothetical protein NIES4101_85720 [Calothrix sp. NIES-4101]|nr:hypothetical protein NIES4101_85720 [Calothrix sp. NIES-4101]